MSWKPFREEHRREPTINDDARFEVSSVEELKKKYGLTAESPPVVTLDAVNVPESLRHLIPWAERFGISDDLIRADYVARAPSSDLDELRRTIREHDALLDEWLAGPAARGPVYSDEYIAFSAMRMAADGC